MTAVKSRATRWGAIVGLALLVTACGGGGGGSETVVAPPPPDARNGTYTMVAADAHEYSLALDFDARTYHVTGNGVDTAGAIEAQGADWLFRPGNASGASGVSTTRFQVATDTIVGEYPLAAGTVPFVAPRKFLTTVADVVGTYNFLGRTVDTAGAAPDTTIQQAQITSDAHLVTCDDAAINDMASCTTKTSGALTVSGDVFTAAIPAGNVVFRVAQVGSDKVFLRASASNGTTRRYIVGTPATATFTGDTFAGGTTEPAWGTVTVTATTFASSGTSPAGTTSTRSGSAVAVSATIPGIRAIDAGTAGRFFAIRSSELGVVVAAQGNATALGFEAIGRKQ